MSMAERIVDTDEPMAIRPADAAKRLSVSKQHLYRMIERGEIRVARLGGRILVPVSELHRIMGGIR